MSESETLDPLFYDIVAYVKNEGVIDMRKISDEFEIGFGRLSKILHQMKQKNLCYYDEKEGFIVGRKPKPNYSN